MKYEKIGSLEFWFKDVELDGYSVRGVVIRGENRLVVWDTLSHPVDMAGYRDLVGGRELIIVYSHADWDHIWGTAGLVPDGLEIIAHEACLRRFASEVPATLAAKRAAEPGRWDDVELWPPTRTFATSTTISLGESVMELHSLPGHTSDSIVAFLPQEGVLLAGDCVETPLPEISNSRGVDNWLAKLGHWLVEPRLQTVIPAHGPTGGPEILQQTIGYLEKIQQGDDPFAGTVLPEFYQQTHRANMGKMVGH